MTNDTRIALEKIQPLAYDLNIEVTADNDFLYCNGQAIGIMANSTYATIMEFIAYAYDNLCKREYRFKNSTQSHEAFEDAVKRYWYTKEQVAKQKTLKCH